MSETQGECDLLAKFVDAARDEAVADLSAAERWGARGCADVFARLDARAQAPLPRSGAAPLDGGLGALATAARDEALFELAAAQTREIPARRLPQRELVAAAERVAEPGRSRSVTGHGSWRQIAAVAAVVLVSALGIGLKWGASARQADGSLGPAQQAQFEGESGDDIREAGDAQPRRLRAKGRSPKSEGEPATALERDEEAGVEGREASEVGPQYGPPLPPEAPVKVAPKVRSMPPTARKRPARLRELADAGQQAWRAGDLAGAQASFGQIVTEGGRAPAVEAAYGDLFTLARQRGQAVSPQWRAYLKRFPRGQHADDARAGLCREAAEPQSIDCWLGYLRDFSHGAHRARGRAATEGPAEHDR